MTDWKMVYQRVMADFKQERLTVYVGIMVAFIILGIFLEANYGGSFVLMFLVWLIGFGVDYLVITHYYKDDFKELFTQDKPYVFEGVIIKKVKIEDEEDGFEEFCFDLNISKAFALTKSGKSPQHYYEKLGEYRIAVPESMFLSLKVGQDVHLICEPDDYAWGLVRGDEVIRIES